MPKLKQKALARRPKYSLGRLGNDGVESTTDLGGIPYPTYSSLKAAKDDARRMNDELLTARWKYIVIEL